jgi:hypothetical protein
LRPNWFHYTPQDLLDSILGPSTSVPISKLVLSLIVQIALGLLLLGASYLSIRLLQPFGAQIGDKLVARSTGHRKGRSLPLGDDDCARRAALVASAIAAIREAGVRPE